ncbi:Uncharacterised protein [Halioglobus japonicus]|nr:Uncharacterised protein [Halioglobus japonicus]
MQYIATIVFAIAFGIIIGGAGATYLFIVMEEPSDAAAHSSRTFEAADLDSYRIELEELEAIEACKEQLLGESSN